jgi:2-amino-4-hydroxy-6-hydroxymethyldihydropteridine diphosphokinase
MYYLLGLGSNLSPERHIPEAMVRLLTLTPTLWASASLTTTPCGMMSHQSFINTAVVIISPLAACDLKSALNQIEVAMGRDRNHPLSHRRDRPIDIDILSVADIQRDLQPPITIEPYLAPQIGQILATLHHRPQPLTHCTPLQLDHYTLGCQPIALHRGDGGGYTLTYLEPTP